MAEAMKKGTIVPSAAFLVPVLCVLVLDYVRGLEVGYGPKQGRAYMIVGEARGRSRDRYRGEGPGASRRGDLK